MSDRASLEAIPVPLAVADGASIGDIEANDPESYEGFDPSLLAVASIPALKAPEVSATSLTPVDVLGVAGSVYGTCSDAEFTPVEVLATSI
jgi:hypothetical protein